MMSPVRYPSSRQSLTAFSIFAAASSSPNWYRSIIAALSTCASGFALSCPAMSGADPCTGSYSPGPSVPTAAEGSMPMDPVSMDAASDRMSPKMLPVTMVSNCVGARMICIAALSTYMCDSSTSGYSS